MLGKRRRRSFEPLEPRCLLSVVGALDATATVAISIPTDLTAVPGEEVIAPIRVDNAAGIRSAEIRLQYDTALLNADNSSVRAGDLWPTSGTTIQAQVDDAAGTIAVFIDSAAGLASGAGSLLDIHFSIGASPPVSTTAKIDLQQVRLNEGTIAASPEPQPGPDATDGAIQVLAGNQPPRVTVPESPQSTADDTPLVFSVATGNAITADDPDAGDLPVQLTLTANQGVSTLSGTTGLTFTSGTGTSDTTMTFSGKIADINTALDGLTFVPSAGFEGAASLTIAANDLGHTGPGGAQTSPTSTVVIAVGGPGSIVGFVYADGNNNGLREDFEGLPGVRVVLTGTDRGGHPVSASAAVTNAHGGYRFDGLPTGEYQLSVPQPAAVLPGGPEIRSGIQLAPNQVFSGLASEFREVGLRPEFISNRFLLGSMLPVGSPQWQSLLGQIVDRAETMAVQAAPTNLQISASASVNTQIVASQFVAAPSVSATPRVTADLATARDAGNSIVAFSASRAAAAPSAGSVAPRVVANAAAVRTAGRSTAVPLAAAATAANTSVREQVLRGAFEGIGSQTDLLLGAVLDSQWVNGAAVSGGQDATRKKTPADVLFENASW
jgi:hypothetical protein